LVFRLLLSGEVESKYASVL